MLAQNSIFGHYRVKELLGNGAMGRVYRAVDTRLDREVALKVIREELARSHDYRQRLADEARAAAKIDSPYVVRIWEYSTIEDVPYVSMEYISGRNLLEATREFDVGRRLALAVHIAEGIQAAHAAGLLHGDLKPDNIKLTPDHCPKILDFGLAKQARENNVDEQGQICGTLHYLAPEQLMGRPASFRTDLFAFGVIVYQMVSGKLPFPGEHPAAVAYSLLHEDPVSLGELCADAPDWLDSLVLRMLAKRPEDRFEDAAVVTDQLRSHLGGFSTALDRKIMGRSRSVTVIDLKNQSGDASWDYFCEGFTDDIISELKRRTGLVIMALPSTEIPRDMREVFKRTRSDFVIGGSLMRWQDRFQLRLSVYADEGKQVLAVQKYDEPSSQLFELLGRVASEISDVLERETGVPAVPAESPAPADISAYDYYLQGKSYYQTNRPEALEFAERMFRKALEVNPDMALAHSGLADLYVFKYMAYYDRSEKCIEEARKQAGRALEIEPTLPEGHRSLGRYHMFKGEVGQAKACFLKAVELNPKYSIGYRTLAWLKYQERDFTASFDWATRALQLAPTDTETLLLIGQLHTCRREYTAATATLQRVLEIAPDYGRAYYNLGQVYMKLGVLDPAIANFEMACKYQGDPNCYVDAGWALFLSGDHERARKAFNRSLDSKFFPFIACYSLGFLERSCGNDSLAQDHFRAAVDCFKETDFSCGKNLQMQAYYAMSLAALGEHEAARRQLDEILIHDDLIGDVLYNVARSYSHLGDHQAASMYLEQALQVSPGPSEKEIELDPHFREKR